MNRQQRRQAARITAKGARPGPRPAPRVPAEDSTAALTSALALHQAGDIDRAEAIYRDVIAKSPSNADALHLLGITQSQRGRHADALPLIRRAITAGGEMPNFLSSLGIALRSMGQLDDAIAAYTRAIEIAPDYADARINLGNALQDKGALAEAIAAYESGLGAGAGSASAWNNLGRAREALGDAEGAAHDFNRALEADPNHIEACRNLGDVRMTLGDTAAAIDCYEAIIARDSLDALAHDRMGIALQKLDRLDVAITAHQRAIALQPDSGDAMCNLGVAFQRAGRLAEAIESFEAANALRPGDPQPHSNLGGAYRQMGDADAAVTAYRRARELDPDNAEAHNSLGVALGEKGENDEAAEALNRALALRPDYPEAHNNLGHILTNKGRAEDAIAAFQTAVRHKPDYAEAHYNLGNALAARGDLLGAADAFVDAVRHKRDFSAAHHNLGVALQGAGRLTDAIVSYENALHHAPSLAEARNNIGIVRMLQGRLDDAESDFAAAAELNAIGGQVSQAGMHSNCLFTLNYNPAHDTDSLFAAHRDWDAEHGHPALVGPARFSNTPETERRLRVGYVSPDFQQHSVAFFFLPLLTHHDRSRVEVFCYGDVPSPDDITRQIAAIADGWRNIAGMDDDAVAAMIRADGIDLLVDLAGHTKGNRLPVFARRPAPVQLSYLGYPTTTGMAAMDYKMSDHHLTPPSTPERFTERLLNLPDSFLCYAPPLEAPEVAPSPAERTGRVTFGSFNGASKVTPAVVALWARLLDAVPDSRLLLKTKAFDDQATRDRYHMMFARRGLSAERVELLGHVDGISGHLGLYGEVDIVLDPFPYNGGTTTIEALWMGVPVVTLAGDRSAARHGVSILNTIGLPELVARTEDAYIRTAHDLAADAGRRAELRTGMRRLVAASPLCNGRRFAHSVEEAYRTAWRDWCGRDSRPDRATTSNEILEEARP